MISNSGYDENHAYHGGAAGDQTGKEWRLLDWYSYPWKCVLRHPDKAVREKIVETSVAAAQNDNIGYDQWQRITYWDELQLADFDPSKITTPCEADCSSGAIANIKAAGYLLGRTELQNISCTTTRDMREKLSAAGFEVLTDDKYLSSDQYLLAGDILLNDDYHVAVNVTDGIFANAETVSTETKEGCEMSNIIGIDVSEHNGKLDWAKIKAAGISFAIIRTGYGTSHVDNQFKNNMAGAIAQGIPIGVYHFSYALNATGAQNEAKYVLSLLEPYKSNITLPVFFDFEYDTVSYAKKQGVTLGKTAFNSHTKAFCDVIKAAGYKAGTYYNLDYYNRYVDQSQLSGLTVWYAQYASKASISNYDIWQYSSSYKISGISANFDVNVLKTTSLLSGGGYTGKTGWQKNSTGWWYVHTDGSYTTSNWEQIDGYWYYFDDKGYMVADKDVEYEGKIYSFDSDGHVTVKDKNGTEEDEDMDVTRFKELWGEMRKELQDNDCGSWSEEARQWAVDNGMIQGIGNDANGEPNYAWADLLTREAAVTLFYRFAKIMGKA